MGNLGELKTIEPKAVWDGVTARIVQGERITMAIVELEPEGVVPEHRHDNEQLGIVLEGSVSFTADEETKLLGPGGTWRIPGGTPHRVRAGAQGAVVVDVFSPPRADWDKIAPEPARPPRWPT